MSARSAVDTSRRILAYSCDTAYAQIGDELGYPTLATEAHAFGFCLGLPGSSACDNGAPPIDLPDAAPSLLPPVSAIGNSEPYAGYSAIGQYDDGATVLQMALVASAIADNGVIMAPHVVDRAVNGYGETEFTYHPHVWRRATSAVTAAEVRHLMTGVTLTPGGTAQGLFASWYAGGGPTIAAKTGTAEPGANTCGTDNWLIALGPAADGQTPTIAVAAMVPVTQAECFERDLQPDGGQRGRTGAAAGAEGGTRPAGRLLRAAGAAGVVTSGPAQRLLAVAGGRSRTGRATCRALSHSPSAFACLS